MTLDLDQLEALALAATPGPWRVGAYPAEIVGDTHVCVDTDIGVKVLLRGNENFYEEARANAAFSAAADRDTVLALIAEVRALRELIARIPATPEAMIAFIGPHFGSMEPQGWESDLSTPIGDLNAVRYSLTVHDLLSAFDWVDLSPDAIDAARREKA